MKLILPGIEYFSRRARAKALLGCVLVVMGLNSAMAASDPAPVVAPGNAVTTGTSSGAGTNATPTLSQEDTNAPGAAAVTNLSAEATNGSPTAATNTMVALDDKHKLTIGDRLSFQIVEDEEDPKPLFVTDSGDIDVPIIGRVPAEGKTCRQLAADIKTALEKDDRGFYRATVILAVDLMTKSHGRVYLVGAVRLPGPVELPGDEVLTLSRAILRAGGFTDYAKEDKVMVTRSAADSVDTGKEAKKTFTVDVEKIFKKQKIDTDLPLESGDLIYVPDRVFRF
jgi:protein involved in polysaccharide export with SLBB domain